MSDQNLQTVEIEGVALHHRLTGSPDRQPVIIFANSLGTDFRIWSAVVDHLATDHTVLLYDKRGHGLSGLGRPPYTLDDHVADLAGLLDHFAITNAVICGLSVGGLIAQGLYHARPDLVRALVLCATAAKIGDAAMWNDRIAAVEDSGLESVADRVMATWFTEAFRRNDAAFAACRAMLVRNSVAGYVGTCVALRGADYTAQAADIRVPAICVAGDSDESTPPEVVAATARLIPGAAYREISDAKHIPCVEQPAQLAAIVREFMSALQEAS